MSSCPCSCRCCRAHSPCGTPRTQRVRRRPCRSASRRWADDVLRLQRLADLAIDVADRRRPAVADAGRHILPDIRKDARWAVDAEQIFDPADKPCKKVGHIRLKPLPLLRDALADAVDDGLADAGDGRDVRAKSVDQRDDQLGDDRQNMPAVGDDAGRQRDDDLQAGLDDLRQRGQDRVDEVGDDDRDGVDQLRQRSDKAIGQRQQDLHSSLHQQRDGLRRCQLIGDALHRRRRGDDDARQLIRDAEQQRQAARTVDRSPAPR